MSTVGSSDSSALNRGCQSASKELHQANKFFSHLCYFFFRSAWSLISLATLVLSRTPRSFSTPSSSLKLSFCK
jgi:hypothetical protein